MKEAVLHTPFPLLDRESFPSRRKPVFIPAIRGQTCINLTQTGLKPVRFMQTPHTPRPRIPALDICIGELLHKPHPMEASSRPARMTLPPTRR